MKNFKYCNCGKYKYPKKCYPLTAQELEIAGKIGKNFNYVCGCGELVYLP